MGPDASKAAACATVNHHQNTPQNQTKTQRHTTHENCLTLLSEALKEEVITLPRQRPDCIWRREVRSRFRNSKPPSEHAPKPDKDAAPHHPRKLPNVAFWSPKRRSYYTAKATTRLHLEKIGPQPLPQQSTTIRTRPKTRQKRSATPRKLPNVAFWSPKRRSYYTAKATTRLHLEKIGPQPLPQQ